MIDLLGASDIDAEVRTVTVTAGQQASLEGGTWAIPKKELVGVLQVLLQARRLKVAPGLPEAPTLVRELTMFQAKVTVATGEPGGGLA